MNLSYFFTNMFKDVAIDLGTSTTLIYVRKKGIVLIEPTIVTINDNTKKVLEVGKNAKKAIGKTPINVSVIKPIESGVISDFEIVKKMLSFFIKKIKKEEKQDRFLFPVLFLRIFITVPSGLSQAEKKIVYDLVKSAGAWKVYIVPESIAIAVGAFLPLEQAKGNFIVDIGAGLTDIAVVSFNGIVQSKSLKIAGNKLDQDIFEYIKSKYNLLIGTQTAEKIKLELGSLYPVLKTTKSSFSNSRKFKKSMTIRGKDLSSNSVVKEIIIGEEEISSVLENSINPILLEIKNQLNIVPAELMSDIMHSGIYLTGGGALLPGLDKLISTTTKIPVITLDDPKTTLIRGLGIIMEDTKKIKNLTEKRK